MDATGLYRANRAEHTACATIGEAKALASGEAKRGTQAQLRCEQGFALRSLRAELIGSDTCMAAGITARGHAPVLKLCRQLLAAGHDPTVRLEAYRGKVLCFVVRTIGKGAGLTVEDDKLGRPKVRRWHASSGSGAASPVRPFAQSDRVIGGGPNEQPEGYGREKR